MRRIADNMDAVLLTEKEKSKREAGTMTVEQKSAVLAIQLVFHVEVKMLYPVYSEFAVHVPLLLISYSKAKFDTIYAAPGKITSGGMDVPFALIVGITEMLFRFPLSLRC